MSATGFFTTIVICFSIGLATSEIEPLWLRRVVGLGLGGIVGCACAFGARWLDLP